MSAASTDPVTLINIPLLCGCCPVDCSVIQARSLTDATVSRCCVQMNGEDFSADPMVGWGDPYSEAVSFLVSIFGSTTLNDFGGEWAFTTSASLYGSKANCESETDATGSVGVDVSIQCVEIEGVEYLRLLIAGFSELGTYPPTELPTRLTALGGTTKPIRLTDPDGVCPPIDIFLS